MARPVMMDVGSAVDADINLSIPLRSIFEEFYCPICFETITNCHITACGHNFCKNCVEECLNRKHACPICSAPTTADKLVPNKHFDRLCSIIQVEKDKSSKIYFESLINGSVNKGSNVQAAPLSPIETLFQTYMKKSLSGFDEYHQKLQIKSEKKKQEIKDHYTGLMGKAKGDDEIARLSGECEVKLKEEDQAYHRSTELLLKSYEDYLKNSSPSPNFLPIAMDIIIQEKQNHKIPSVSVKPTDTSKELKALIEERFRKNGDPILKWSPENIFVLQIQNGGPLQPIANEDIPIVQYQPLPGSLLILRGHIECASNAPKTCFKSTFVKDKEMVMDYFGCKTCGFNWICKSCAETCHKGHQIVDYIHNHKPSWACCYCVKKGKCVLYKEPL